MARFEKMDRRAFIGAMAAIVALASAGPLRALALVHGQHFRAITIDDGPMSAKGGRALVELMRRSTAIALQKTFGDILTPGDRSAPVLRVVLDSASFATSSSGDDQLSPATDYLEGSGHVIGPRGENFGDFPILASRSSAPMNRLDPINGNVLRAQLLAESFTSWLRREMGV